MARTREAPRPLLSRLDLHGDRPMGLHDRVIGSLDQTRPTWLRSGALLQHSWHVETSGRKNRRNPVVAIAFTTPIAPGPSLLTDRVHERDLVTAKVVAYRLLQSGLEAHSVLSAIDGLFSLIRWRLSRCLYAMSDLTPDYFEEFVDRVREGGRTHLIDFSERTEEFKKLVIGDPSLVPMLKRPDQAVVARNEVARALGMPLFSALPPALRQDLIAFLEGQGFPVGGTKKQARASMSRSLPSGPKPVTYGGMLPGIQAWSHLWRFRDFLPHDPLSFNPFESRSFKEILSTARVQPGRTLTVPPKQACYLLDRALRWVVDYSPELLRILAAGAPIRSIPDVSERRARHDELIKTARFSGPSAPRLSGQSYWTNADGSAERTVSTHRAVYQLLVVACAIVIATFAARRDKEVADLRANCILKDDSNRAWLEFWVEKTLRDYGKVPVPAAVEAAVGVILALRQSSGSPHTSPWLFDFVVPGTTRRVTFTFGAGLRAFAAYCHVPALPNGNEWTFRPHQLRRFFSITYAHRYKYAHLTALTLFLMHFDDSSTQTYITESTKGALSSLNDEGRPSENSLDPWYKKYLDHDRRVRQHVQTAVGHLPSDWEQAVRHQRSLVDLLSPHASAAANTINDSLGELVRELNAGLAR